MEARSAPETRSQSYLTEEYGSYRVRAAVEEVLSDPSYKRHAGRLAREMAKCPTAEEVLTRLSALTSSAEPIQPKTP